MTTNPPMALLSIIPTLAQAAAGASVMSATQCDQELAAADAAIQLMSKAAKLAQRKGNIFGLKQWRDVVDVANVAERLAQRQIASNLLSDIEAAQQALAEVISAANATKRWVISTDQLHLIKQLIWIYRIQLKFASLRELDAAKAHVWAVCQQAKRGNIAPGVTVHDIPTAP